MGTVQRRFCPHCDRLVNSVKDGYVMQDQRQRYRCKVCNRTWTDERRKPNLKKETPEERKSYQAQILRAAGVSDKRLRDSFPVSGSMVRKKGRIRLIRRLECYTANDQRHLNLSIAIARFSLKIRR